MSDIFISYDSSDAKRAETIAKALKKKGWSVWWDRKIPPGKEYAKVIKDEDYQLH
ncbi:MAG: TIR domain-containing protein [Deltaproteobacteria bacterium]|nr:TIR domain-containing protein [Deltaproteobacteria bacterium]